MKYIKVLLFTLMFTSLVAVEESPKSDPILQLFEMIGESEVFPKSIDLLERSFSLLSSGNDDMPSPQWRYLESKKERWAFGVMNLRDRLDTYYHALDPNDKNLTRICNVVARAIPNIKSHQDIRRKKALELIGILILIHIAINVDMRIKEFCIRYMPGPILYCFSFINMIAFDRLLIAEIYLITMLFYRCLIEIEEVYTDDIC